MAAPKRHRIEIQRDDHRRIDQQPRGASPSVDFRRRSPVARGRRENESVASSAHRDSPEFRTVLLQGVPRDVREEDLIAMCPDSERGLLNCSRSITHGESAFAVYLTSSEAKDAAHVFNSSREFDKIRARLVPTRQTISKTVLVADSQRSEIRLATAARVFNMHDDDVVPGPNRGVALLLRSPEEAVEKIRRYRGIPAPRGMLWQIFFSRDHDTRSLPRSLRSLSPPLTSDDERFGLRAETRSPVANVPLSDSLVARRLASDVSDDALLHAFPNSLGINRLKKSNTCFIRFRSREEAADALKHGGGRLGLALEYALVNIPRRWCVVVWHQESSDGVVLEKIAQQPGFCQSFVIRRPDHIIKTDFASERDAVTAAMALRAAFTRTHVEVHWFKPLTKPPACELFINEISLQLNQAAIEAACRGMGATEFDVTWWPRSAQASFPDAAAAAYAANALLGVPLHGVCPVGFDFVAGKAAVGIRPREEDPASAERPPPLPQPPAESYARLPDTPKLTNTQTALDSLQLEPTAKAHRPSAPVLDGRSATRLYERLVPGQSQLPPGWTYVVRNGSDVLLDHVTRRGYPKARTTQIIARFEEQMEDGATRAAAFHDTEEGDR
jgi:hypothetical protein